MTMNCRNLKYILISLLILIAYVIPYFILREDTPILIHDVHDSLHIRYILNIIGGQVPYSNESVPPLFERVSPITFSSLIWLINPTLWLYYFFSPFMAYVLNISIVHFIAFAGMYLLLSNHILKDEKYAIISSGVALSFALLPFLPLNGLRIAGMPLALYAFLNIREGISSYKDWMLIFLIPFWAPYTHSFVFFLTGVGILWLLDAMRKKSVNFPFFASICLMNSIFLLRNLDLIYKMLFNSNYTSQRIEFSNKSMAFEMRSELQLFFSNFVDNFIYGQYHANSLHQLAIGLALLLALIIIQMKIIYNISGSKNSNSGILFGISIVSVIGIVSVISISTYFTILIMWATIIFLLGALLVQLFLSYFAGVVNIKLKRSISGLYNDPFGSEQKLLLYLLCLCLIISLFYSLWSSNLFDIVKQHSKLLVTFNFSRFNALHPLIWYIIFALSLKTIQDNLKFENISKISRIIVILLLLFQVGYLFTFSSESNLYQVGGLGILKSEQMSYREFYSESLFHEIDICIGKPQNSYKIASIGIHPSVSQFNGFNTIDFYNSEYPLEYKHQFRRIIENELAKNEEIKNYFDYWGGRCYLFTNETVKDFVITKDKNIVIENLQINTEALKEMDCTYIISTAKIENYEENNLEFVRIFEEEGSPWKIWLYEVK